MTKKTQKTPGKRGRKPAKKPLCRSVSVRFQADQHEMVAAAAEISGAPEAEFIREAAYEAAEKTVKNPGKKTRYQELLHKYNALVEMLQSVKK